MNLLSKREIYIDKPADETDYNDLLIIKLNDCCINETTVSCDRGLFTPPNP